MTAEEKSFGSLPPLDLRLCHTTAAAIPPSRTRTPTTTPTMRPMGESSELEPEG
jgi:hypothetical protein